MNILISGPNACGKSSMCERLLSQFPEMILTHFSNPKDMEDGKKQYFDFVKSMKNSKSYLFDRFHDGEWVYAPIFRGYTADYLIEFEEKLYALDYIPFFIYMCADIADVTRRIEKRGEDFVKPEHYAIERENFDKFVVSQHLPYCIVDTSKYRYNNAFKRVLSSIEKYEKVRELTKGWDKLPRGDINAEIIYVVEDTDNDNSKILRGDVLAKNIWITTNKALSEQVDIIEPRKVIYEKWDKKKVKK